VALRAAVFDFDGVLVDSEPLHYRSLRDALRPEGVEISEEEYQHVYLAYDDREAIRLALEHHGDGRVQSSCGHGRPHLVHEPSRGAGPVAPPAVRPGALCSAEQSECEFAEAHAHPNQ